MHFWTLLLSWGGHLLCHQSNYCWGCPQLWRGLSGPWFFHLPLHLLWGLLHPFLGLLPCNASLTLVMLCSTMPWPIFAMPRPMLLPQWKLIVLRSLEPTVLSSSARDPLLSIML